MKRKVFRVFILFFILFGLIQFKTIDRINPQTSVGNDFFEVNNISDKGNHVLVQACYDCHSNETLYPWYSYVAPWSWMIEDHVSHGRGEFNFSEWGEYPISDRRHIIKECIELIQKDEMPLKGYVNLHPEARLDSEKKAFIIEVLRSSK